MAFQALYSWDANQAKGTPISEELLNFSWASQTPDEETTVFSRLLVTGTIENINAVDEMIQKHLENWDLKRLNRVDLAIIRMSVYTLMFQTDMPYSIVIDEAIDISKEFGTDDSYRFVNGVLDGVRKTVETK